MNAIPTATVKMLAYNHAAYVRKAIEGVISQKTNFRFELVIGEGCSTDGTRKIVLEYQRRYPGSPEIQPSPSALRKRLAS